jgi:phosphatidylglycerol:prolipoprotein diacylglycerol transferase
VFLVFTFAYGVLRFLLEMIRDDLERGEFGPHIPEHVVIAGGLLIFAGAYAFFMAPSIEDATMRKLTQVVAFVPPVVAYLLLRPPSFADQTLVQLSTSQWVAVLTAVPAAVAYGIYFKAAQAHPESAMALNLEEFYKLHPEAAPGARDESRDEPRDAPSKSRKAEQAADASEKDISPELGATPSEAGGEPQPGKGHA